MLFYNPIIYVYSLLHSLFWTVDIKYRQRICWCYVRYLLLLNARNKQRKISYNKAN